MPPSGHALPLSVQSRERLFSRVTRRAVLTTIAIVLLLPLLAFGGFLAGRTYQREIDQQDIAQVREDAQRLRESGQNEAGQDTANIPRVQPTNEQAECLRDYLSSFGEDAGKRQQRIVAEANEEGIPVYEAAGC
jgi:hypothetical protein